MSQIFEDVSDPTLAKLVERWFAWRSEGTYPSRKSIEPTELGSALPFVWICQREPELDCYRYHLVGEAVNTLYGKGLRGRSLGEFLAENTAAKLKQRLDECLASGLLVHSVAPQTLHDKRQVVVQRLFLPMTGPTGDLDTILGCTRVTDHIAENARHDAQSLEAIYASDGTRLKIGSAIHTMYSANQLY